VTGRRNVEVLRICLPAGALGAVCSIGQDCSTRGQGRRPPLGVRKSLTASANAPPRRSIASTGSRSWTSRGAAAGDVGRSPRVRSSPCRTELDLLAATAIPAVPGCAPGSRRPGVAGRRGRPANAVHVHLLDALVAWAPLMGDHLFPTEPEAGVDADLRSGAGGHVVAARCAGLRCPVGRQGRVERGARQDRPRDEGAAGSARTCAWSARAGVSGRVRYPLPQVECTGAGASTS